MVGLWFFRHAVFAPQNLKAFKAFNGNRGARITANVCKPIYKPKINFAVSFPFPTFAFGLVRQAVHIEKRSVYARLVTENVRNFRRQESVIVRALCVDCYNYIFLHGNSHDLQLKKWYISATLLLYNCLWGAGG